jgi:hypothetical protein
LHRSLIPRSKAPIVYELILYNEADVFMRFPKEEKKTDRKIKEISVRKR